MLALKQVLEHLVFLRHEGFGTNYPGIREVACAIPEPIYSVQRKTFLLFFFDNLIVDGFGGCIRRSIDRPGLVEVLPIAPQPF